MDSCFIQWIMVCYYYYSDSFPELASWSLCKFAPKSFLQCLYHSLNTSLLSMTKKIIQAHIVSSSPKCWNQLFI